MATKDWTVLVYMGADDADDAQLQAAAFQDLEEMRRVGSSDRVNIAVQMDLHLFPPVRFLIKQDRSLNVARNLGLGLRRESSTGRPGTLLSFLKWATEKVPARHYLLILWGHGLGVGFSVEISQTKADVVFDGEDALTIPELAGVLRRFRHINGKPLDLLGFDACYMSSAEVGYECRELIEFMVGSQVTLPFEGWPYESVLGYLRSHPRAAPASVAKAIARSVVRSYPRKRTVTQTALRPAGADDVAAATRGLVIALERAVRDNGEARSVRRAFTGAKFLGARQFLDLKDLCQRLVRNCRAPQIRASARKTVEALDQRAKGLVFDHRTRGRLARGLNGTSIYVDWVRSKPGEEKVNLKPKNYRRLRFVRKTGWEGFNKRFGRLKIR